MIEITQLKDMIQEEPERFLDVPEIRVWCHPHKEEKSGEDYYEVFDNFDNAHEFIKAHPTAEDQPLIAFQGYEINIYAGVGCKATDVAP